MRLFFSTLKQCDVISSAFRMETHFYAAKPSKSSLPNWCNKRFCLSFYPPRKWNACGRSQTAGDLFWQCDAWQKQKGVDYLWRMSHLLTLFGENLCSGKMRPGILQHFSQKTLTRKKQITRIKLHKGWTLIFVKHWTIYLQINSRNQRKELRAPASFAEGSCNVWG